MDRECAEQNQRDEKLVRRSTHDVTRVNSRGGRVACFIVAISSPRDAGSPLFCNLQVEVMATPPRAFTRLFITSAPIIILSSPSPQTNCYIVFTNNYPGIYLYQNTQFYQIMLHCMKNKKMSYHESKKIN